MGYTAIKNFKICFHVESITHCIQIIATFYWVLHGARNNLFNKHLSGTMYQALF